MPVKTLPLALAGFLLLAAPLAAQTPPSTPPAGETAAPPPEEQPAPATPPATHGSHVLQKKSGGETGWTGDQKTDQEQEADPKRNEAEGPQPK